MNVKRPSTATTIACLALFVALGGPSEAARTVGLKQGSVTSASIKNGSVSIRDLSAAAVRQLRTPRPGSVDGAAVRTGSLNGTDIAAASVPGDRLTPNSVGSAQVVNNSLGTDDIADGAIDSQELKDASVLGRDLGEGTIGAREVSGLAAGDIGEYAGSVGPLDFGVIAAGDCRSVSSTSLTPLRPGLTLADDVVIVTPRTGFPSAGLTVGAKAVAENQIEVTICNVDGPATVNLGTETLRYLAIDTTAG